MFKNREIIHLKGGRTYCISQFEKSGKWNLVNEYASSAGNKVFNTREECLEYILQDIGATITK